MFRIFNKYSFVAYALLPVVLLLFRIPLFMSPEVSMTSYDEDLYTPVWNLLFGYVGKGSVLSIVLALVVVFLTALFVNRLTNSFRFTERQSNLGGFYFIILTSGFLVSQGFHPICLFVLLFVVALMRLFDGAQSNYPERYCYDAGVLFSMGSLLWAKGLWMLLFHVVVLIMLRMFTLRTVISTLLGMFTPVVLALTYFFYTDNLVAANVDYIRCAVVPVAFYKTSILAKSYLVVLSIVLLMATLHIFRKMPTQKIIESRYSKIMIWIIIYSVAMLMLPHYSFEVQQLIAVSGAIILSSYMQSMRSKLMAEIITLILVVLVWCVQWLS
jgi:hypothetical protein